VMMIEQNEKLYRSLVRGEFTFWGPNHWYAVFPDNE